MLACNPDVSAAVDEPVASSEAEGRDGAEGEAAATVFASEAEADDWPDCVPAVGCDAVRAVVDDVDDDDDADDDAAVEARRRTAMLLLLPRRATPEAMALRAMNVDAACAMMRCDAMHYAAMYLTCVWYPVIRSSSCSPSAPYFPEIVRRRRE